MCVVLRSAKDYSRMKPHELCLHLVKFFSLCFFFARHKNKLFNHRAKVTNFFLLRLNFSFSRPKKTLTTRKTRRFNTARWKLFEKSQEQEEEAKEIGKQIFADSSGCNLWRWIPSSVRERERENLHRLPRVKEKKENIPNVSKLLWKVFACCCWSEINSSYFCGMKDGESLTRNSSRLSPPEWDSC